MNEKEQEVAKALLEKIQSAKSEEVVQFATAYQLVTQGALNRANAEAQAQNK